MSDEIIETFDNIEYYWTFVGTPERIRQPLYAATTSGQNASPESSLRTHEESENGSNRNQRESERHHILATEKK